MFQFFVILGTLVLMVSTSQFDDVVTLYAEGLSRLQVLQKQCERKECSKRLLNHPRVQNHAKTVTTATPSMRIAQLK